jgi:hypothetical protein
MALYVVGAGKAGKLQIGDEMLHTHALAGARTLAILIHEPFHVPRLPRPTVVIPIESTGRHLHHCVVIRKSFHKRNRFTARRICRIHERNRIPRHTAPTLHLPSTKIIEKVSEGKKGSRRSAMLLVSFNIRYKPDQ